MFHGKRWMDDVRFSTPMINSQNVGHIYIINYRTDSDGSVRLAKVKLFFKRVHDITSCCTVVYLALLLNFRKMIMKFRA